MALGSVSWRCRLLNKTIAKMSNRYNKQIKINGTNIIYIYNESFTKSEAGAP